jgi:hypothetical protein
MISRTVGSETLSITNERTSTPRSTSDMTLNSYAVLAAKEWLVRFHDPAARGLSVGSGDRDTLPNLLGNCHRIKPPLTRQSADRVETLLKRRDVAAIIMEPISINLGVLIPEKGFFERVEKLCARYGTLFIADEVANGFGRTGKLFAVEHFNLQPDIMCLAKAITGGHSPMGAMLTTAAVGRSMEEKGSFYSTYGWHPLSVAAALATLRPLQRRRKSFLEHVNALSGLFASQLALIRFRTTPKIRVKGLAIALEFDSEQEASRIVERAAKAGLLLTAQDEIVLLLPPLTMTKNVAEKGLSFFAPVRRRRCYYCRRPPEGHTEVCSLRSASVSSGLRRSCAALRSASRAPAGRLVVQRPMSALGHNRPPPEELASSGGNRRLVS